MERSAITPGVIAAAIVAVALGLATASHAQPVEPDGSVKITGLPFTPKGQRGAYNSPDGSRAEGPGDTSPYKSAKAEWEALKKAAHGGLRLTGGELPDWSGVWVVGDTPFDFDPSLARDATHYGPLSPDNQAYYEATLRNEENGIEWDPLSACLPGGFPRFVAAPRLKDFGPTPTVVYMMEEEQAEVRRIYTDGRDHRPDDEAFPLWEGDSIGFWDGKGDHAKLIVWTNNLRANIYMRGQPRFSNQAETIEIYQKVDATHIKLDLTVYDPVELYRPWRVHRHYVKDKVPNGRIDMWSCVENSPAKRNAQGGTDLTLPTEKSRDEDPILGNLLTLGR